MSVAGPLDDAELVAVLAEAASAVRAALDGLQDWGPTGGRAGEYGCDLVADRAAVEVLSSAGLGVVSEESGLHPGSGDCVVVLDPVDGSTNASQGIPWWSTSLYAFDSTGPRAALVVNQCNGTVYQAVRGSRSLKDGKEISPSQCRNFRRAIVGFCGVPRRHLGWGQARVLGAASLDICLVAEGSLDAYLDVTGGSLAPWDYAAAVFICRQAGAFVAEAGGRGLDDYEPTVRRAPVAAATRELLDEAMSAMARGLDA